MRHRTPTWRRDVLTPQGLACVSAMWLASALAAGASALPSYQLVTLGFTDAEHTQVGGFQASEATYLTESYVTGSSERYNGGATYLGESAWIYDPSDATTTRLGYIDATHTRIEGYRSSHVASLSESGYATGNSSRFAGGPALLGATAWLYDTSDDSTTRIGFFDATHTRDDGYQESTADLLAESGFVTGGSSRFDGAADLGRSAWLYDASDDTTTRLGFFDANHTGDDGYQESYSNTLTESGFVTGASILYAGDAYLGQSAWLYDASNDSTTRIGLLDATHTGDDGQQESYAETVTDSGYALGISQRFDGSNYHGESAWFYDASDDSTTRIGVFDVAHTRDDGFQESYAYALSESGYAIGISQRFDGSNYHGESAWFHDASDDSTTRIGFFDVAHTRDDGYQDSDAAQLAGAGFVTGVSSRFDGATDLGQSAWLYDSSDDSTTRLGFFDAAHTDVNGSQHSETLNLTESGYAAGSSARFDGGQSSWLYDVSDDSTTRLGLFDATHTRDDGFQHSHTVGLTASGYVAGESWRFNGAEENGASAWVFDASDDSQSSIILSERSDGYSVSNITFLGEDGLTLGSYMLFDQGPIAFHAFAWTPEDGAFDLGALVDGGLAAQGWAHLAHAIRANGLGMIIGSGRLLSGGDLAYLLLPLPIPEPGTGLLVAAGLFALVVLRKPKRNA